MTKEECENSFYCDNPLCPDCTEAECLASGYCSALPGCYHNTDTNVCSETGRVDGWLTGTGVSLWTNEGCRYYSTVHQYVDKGWCLNDERGYICLYF